MNQRLVKAVLAANLVGACGAPAGHPAHGGHHGHHGFANATASSKMLDDPSRDEWQRPDDVIRALALEPRMTVADVGAGTGYFAVRLARAVPEGLVIGTDIEPDMARFLEERARREQLTNLRAVTSTAHRSGLAPGSVDRILVVDVWHHLEKRQDYARDLAAALRPGGRIAIVDFTATAKHGPPASMRITPEAMIAELEAAGMKAVRSPVTLPDQYIVEAWNIPPAR